MTTYAKQKRPRNEGDFYATPKWVTQALLSRVAIGYPTVCDPCCGSGAILRELSARVDSTVDVVGVELSDERHTAIFSRNEARCVMDNVHAYCADWFTFNLFSTNLGFTEKDTAIVMNPPFCLAAEFVTDCVLRFPFVAALLRLNFLASQGRRELIGLRPPQRLLVLSKRPSFTEDGKTDASDYAWFVWDDRLPRDVCRIEVV